MPIPKQIRDQLSEDPFMRTCVVNTEDCEGHIEWQHFFTYGGKRQSEIYGILPLCHYHHWHQAQYIAEQEGAMRQRIVFFRAESEFKVKYPRSTLLDLLQ